MTFALGTFELDGRVFAGPPSPLCGAYDRELEPAAVIGRPARDVSPEDALSLIAGAEPVRVPPARGRF